jgi:hypothetical protein
MAGLQATKDECSRAILLIRKQPRGSGREGTRTVPIGKMHRFERIDMLQWTDGSGMPPDSGIPDA